MLSNLTMEPAHSSTSSCLHAAETAMAERDTLQVEQYPSQKNVDCKLQVKALLINNIETIATVQAREQQTAQKQAKQQWDQRGHSQRGRKRQRSPEIFSSEEDKQED